MRIFIGWIAQVVGHNGGMERVSINFANEMVQRGHEVILAYCTEHSGEFCFSLDARVRVINLAGFLPGHKYESLRMPTGLKIKREILRIIHPAGRKNMNTWFKIYRLKDAVRQVLHNASPDVVVTMDSATTAVFQSANVGRKYPVIAMNHFSMTTVLEQISDIEKKALQACDAIQVLMAYDKDILQRGVAGIRQERIWRIPNSVPQYEVDNAGKELLITEVARLEKKVKRQHLLIEAFSQIANNYPQWRLELWGEEQHSDAYTRELRHLIEEHHLQERSALCGNSNDVLSVYRRASIFVFPSIAEGFGLSLAEAMSAGLPVVAYRSCLAAKELIRNGETGILVEDGVGALAEGLKVLMGNAALRERIGKAAHEAMKQFAPEKIWNQWENLLKEVVSGHRQA